MTSKIIQQIHNEEQGGALTRYKRIQVGEASWGFLIWFELLTLFLRNLPGLPGLLLRGVFYRTLLGSAGGKIIWGTGITLRNPRAIHLGDQVVIDDLAVLDAKGTPSDGIRIGKKSFISRGAIISLKGGSITIGAESSVGPYCLIQSIGDAKVDIGDFVAIAPYCYVVGAPDYGTSSTDLPMIQQPFAEALPVSIGDDVWVGTSVTILRGAEVGKGSIIGANCVVRGQIPEYAIATGSSLASVRKSRISDPKVS